jgi:DNA-binding LacI/PurR family transcriptional regulator
MVLLDCGEEDQRMLGDPYLMELARGLQEALLRSGYGPVLNASRGTLQSLVPSEAIHGVVLAFGHERPLLAREIAGRGTPCVVIKEHPIEESPRVGLVYLDLDSGARAAARLLISYGHRRIGFIGNYEDDAVRVSFTQELMTAGVPLPAEREIMARAGREAGAEAMRRMLNLSEPPTAVMARTDLLASGALQAARQLGLHVPEDLSLIGHDDIPLARQAGLTTVRIDCAALGRAAAEVLSRLLRGGPVDAAPPVVPTRVIERNSVSRPKPSGASGGPPAPPA